MYRKITLLIYIYLNMKTIAIENKDKLYFTSDLHLGHENIIALCNRPFTTIDEMDKALIDNWNSIVTDSDTIFILGDFSWRLGDKGIKRYLDQLSGNKIFIKGNHDKNEKPFSVIYDGFVNIKVADSDDKAFGGYQHITLCHYPMLSWYHSHRGAWQLFGHWHNVKVTSTLLEDRKAEFEVKEYVKEEHLYMDRIRKNQYDVGVDGNSYKPISYNFIKEFFKKDLEMSK